MEVVENSYVNLGGDQVKEGSIEKIIFLFCLFFGKFEEIVILEGVGVYGGGDMVFFVDLFVGQMVMDEYM